ncbi:MAG: hypothetical protein HUU55_07175 [Myxococcales bacterium]|nr:hypothetical protein [Myxococcales bacterium]
MKNGNVAFLTTAFFFSLPLSFAQAVPQAVPYVGYLTHANGIPYDGVTLEVTAALYPAASSGQPLWGPHELGPVTVNDGIFAIVLGGGASPDLDLTLADNDEVWIEFVLDDGVKITALSPRQQVRSVPYALVAGNAQQLGGIDAAEYLVHGDAADVSSLTVNGKPVVDAGGGWVGGKLPETDPAFMASAAAGITAAQIGQWNSAFGWGNHTTAGYLKTETDPKIGSTQTGKWCVGTGTQIICDQTAPAGGTGGVKVINASNYKQTTFQNGDMVRIEGIITVTQDYQALGNAEGLTVVGGGFLGTAGTEEVDLGDEVTVFGATFENILLDGNSVRFVNCIFKGNIRLPFDAHVYGSRFSAATSGTQFTIGVIHSTEIDNSTIKRVRSISDSDINNSTIAGTALNFEVVDYIANTRISDSTVYLRSDSRFVGNECGNSLIVIPPETSSGVVISGNIFDGLLEGQTEVLRVHADTSNFRMIQVTGNNFTIQTGDPRSIFVTGTATGTSKLQLLLIANNNFLKGGKAIEYTSTAYTAITGNTTRATSLGVSANATLQLSNNFSF